MSNTIHRGYTPWIRMYASDTYRAAVADDRPTKDRLMAERGGPARLPTLAETFAKRRG